MKIHQIDLHYHAGRERENGKSLREYLLFARATGRKILGITDHANLFQTPSADGPFTESTANFRRLRAEMEALRPEFPDIQLFLGPELSPNFSYSGLEPALIEVSDYFIFEHEVIRGDKQKNTESLFTALERCAEISEKTGKPTFLAHPFRTQMYYRYDTFDYGPEEYGGKDGITGEEAAGFLSTDLAAFGGRAAELGVPIEMNGVTLYRAACLNRPYFRDVVCRAYKELSAHGAEFVPGSDQHLLSVGKGATPIPEDVFAYLGIRAEDIPFLRRIGAKL